LQSWILIDAQEKIGIENKIKTYFDTENLEHRSISYTVYAKFYIFSKELNVEYLVPNGGDTMLDQHMGNLFRKVMPQRKLSDLILPNEVQQICHGLILEQHRADLLRSYNVEPRNRMLLIGPPGNGKTSLAEAIAEALVVPLLVVSYESIVGSYLGETAGRLRKLFENASTQKCVLFFDEFETLGKERGELHEIGEVKRVVSSLLMQIDNLPSHIMVIGATNHAELLDRAVWRRFQIRMTLPGPSRACLTKWFDNFERRINIRLGYDAGTLANFFQRSNFAEVEEFGMTVYRQYVLEQPNADMKDIVSQSLQRWSARSVTMFTTDDLMTKNTAEEINDFLDSEAATQDFWRSIETAPKDGTRILLSGGYTNGFVFIGSWKKIRRREGWQDDYGRSITGLPTHWMPLPDNPSGTQMRSQVSRKMTE
jgi:DNA-binding transcriptional regulator/RsmH inhibitor MraZ